MTVYLGAAGAIELLRAAPAEGISTRINSGDVNAARNSFSFDFEAGTLITGDQVSISTVDGSRLSFVAGWAYPDGKWYISVDEVGGICLYDTFADAVNDRLDGRIKLESLARPLAIRVLLGSVGFRVLGRVTSYELNTARDAVDVTELGEEFHQQHATLISGSGSITCFFDYRAARCGEDCSGGDVELSMYLHQLVVRQQLGAAFSARLYVLRRGEGHDSNDEIWYDINALITNAGVAISPSEPIRSTLQFVTTGPIYLRVKSVSGYYVLQETEDRILLEASMPPGALLQEGEE